jgi:hypothetical protein
MKDQLMSEELNNPINIGKETTIVLNGKVKIV